MKKGLICFFVLFVSVSGFAYDENNNVYIGFETGSYKYEEPHMEYPISFKGHKVGASFEWVGRRILEVTGLKDSGDNSFATFEARYMTGDVKYKGYLQEIEMIGGAIHTNYTPIQMNDVPDYYIEGRVTLGQTYNFKDVCEIWPYIGFGYRRLSNKTEKVDAENGYKRVSQYWYIPIGFRLVKGSDGGFKISFISEFDWLIHGEQASQIGNVVEQMFPEVETNYVYNYQRRGWGARFSVKLEAPVTKHAGIFVEPYFRMWKIQNSSWGEGDVHTYEGYYEYWYNIPFKEPFNVTKELGIRAGIYF